MAIDFSEFTEKGIKGVKANKDFTKFLFQLTHEKKRTRKIYTITQTAWGKITRVENAEKEFAKFKNGILSAGEISPYSKLDDVMEQYFEEEAGGSDTYNESRIRGYENYVKPTLGAKPVNSINLSMMNKIKVSMQKKGKTEQTKNGCKPKTINEVIVNTLIPILQYAKDNGAIAIIPAFKKLKTGKTKPKPTKAILKISALYQAIMVRYEDDPYYRAMFLFALFGRRFNEIATLHTSDIDFVNKSYTIRAENNKTDTELTSTLPQPLIVALMELQPDVGLVFDNGKEQILSPRKQVLKLREDTGIEELTMHYFRHIVASALVSVGENVAIAASLLNHANTATTEKYYAQMQNEEFNKKGVDAIQNLLTQISVN